jgi:hypothetical protein
MHPSNFSAVRVRYVVSERVRTMKCLVGRRRARISAREWDLTYAWWGREMHVASAFNMYMYMYKYVYMYMCMHMHMYIMYIVLAAWPLNPDS